MGNKMIEDFENLLDEILATGKKFAIWGAGYEGHNCIQRMNKYTENKLAPAFIIDNNKATWGKGGVISPDEFFARKDEVEIVLICVYVADLVEAQIREGGYTGRLQVVLTTVIYSQGIMDIYEKNPDKVELVRGLFCDKRSIDTMDAFIKVGKTGDISYFKGVNGDSRTKLIDTEILNLNDYEKFVDVGAFTGDTIVEFLRACNGKYKKIIGIEPEPENYKVLNEYLDGIEDAFPMCVACDAHSGEAMFNSESSESGALTPNGDIQVHVKRLDDIAEAKDTTFIKVSAIGREYLILKGAEEIIRKNKPKIAYYCFGELIWEIPLYLKSITEDYNFYIRHYGYGMQAMVGYAIIN